MHAVQMVCTSTGGAGGNEPSALPPWPCLKFSAILTEGFQPQNPLEGQAAKTSMRQQLPIEYASDSGVLLLPLLPPQNHQDEEE